MSEEAKRHLSNDAKRHLIRALLQTVGNSDLFFKSLERDLQAFRQRVQELIGVMEKLNEKEGYERLIAFERLERNLSWQSRKFIEDLISADLHGDLSDLARKAEETTKEIQGFLKSAE